MRTLKDLRWANGKLPTFTYPDGDPLYYIGHDGYIFCADCANQVDTGLEIEGYGINEEEDEMLCEHCGQYIE
jgi:hypothetical protein